VWLGREKRPDEVRSGQETQKFPLSDPKLTDLTARKFPLSCTPAPFISSHLFSSLARSSSPFPDTIDSNFFIRRITISQLDWGSHPIQIQYTTSQASPPAGDMKKIFGAKKNKEPPPTIQDATDGVCIINQVPSFIVYQSLQIHS